MKVFVLAAAVLLSATKVFALREEVLFTCEGNKNKAGYTNVFTVKTTQSGKWQTIFSLRDYAEAEAQPQALKVIKAESMDNGCIVSLEQFIPDKEDGITVPMKLIYEEKDLTLKGKKGSAFANASCRILSKSMREQLNDCEIKSKPKVSQGIFCRSEKVDETENHLRIDVNKDLTYAERSVYQLFKGKTTELGTRQVDISASPIEGGKECEVTVKEINANKNQKMKLVMKLKKPFGSGDINGRVEESKIVYNSENLTMPDHFKNMKCEFSGDFYEQVKSCDIAMSAEGTNDETSKAYKTELPGWNKSNSNKGSN